MKVAKPKSLMPTNWKTDRATMSHAENSALEDFLQHSQQRVENSLKQVLDDAAVPPRLAEAMAYACLDGGKRVRPALVYAACTAVRGIQEAADKAACAVELIHSYSLVHDDLPAMDDDDLRRGKPSVHKAFDEATAILVGDALQTLAFSTLSTAVAGLNGEQQLNMLQCLARAAGPAGMVGGQMLDFEAVGKALDASQLKTLHGMKTGALIKTAVQLGGLSSNAVSHEQLAALVRYGDNIGLAFQVQDDILDETADTATLGKPQGSDSRQNKPTYVSLLGLDQARALCSQLTDTALDSLKALPGDASLLRGLAEYLLGRSH